MSRWTPLYYMTPVVIISPVQGEEHGPSDFAVAVEEYVPGIAPQFSDPASALGRPTVDTRGDGGATGSPLDPVVVLPVNPPFRGEEVVSIGEGGHLTLRFDHPVEDDPRNPCGIDFIVFGNALHNLGGGQFWMNGDPNLFTMQLASLSAEPGVVEVSQDGEQWFVFDLSDVQPPRATPLADTAMPTLGRIYDPPNAEPSLPGNQWWGRPTDPTRPVNPDWSAADFVGLTVAQYARRYGCSAGGTGFDLRDVGLDGVRFVRISNNDGDELTPDIDAVSDVRPYTFPDFDCDYDVDKDDIEHFRSCLTGPAIGPPGGDCARADFDRDNDVDQTDFAILQRCISGPDQPAPRDCMPLE